jgi:hypothetical protein
VKAKHDLTLFSWAEWAFTGRLWLQPTLLLLKRSSGQHGYSLAVNSSFLHSKGADGQNHFFSLSLQTFATEFFSVLKFIS